jgi:hypothetical protein
MSESRSNPRLRSLLRGRAIFNNRSSILDCTVRDLTPTGAKLDFGSPDGIPDAFDLEIPLKSRTHRAQVVWRQGNMCGVKFIE